MEQVSLTDPTYLMLKEMSSRKDAIGMQGFLEELIISQYKLQEKSDGKRD